jgi:hypothetical protein
MAAVAALRRLWGRLEDFLGGHKWVQLVLFIIDVLLARSYIAAVLGGPQPRWDPVPVSVPVGYADLWSSPTCGKVCLLC